MKWWRAFQSGRAQQLIEPRRESACFSSRTCRTMSLIAARLIRALAAACEDIKIEVVLNHDGMLYDSSNLQRR